MAPRTCTSLSSKMPRDHDRPGKRGLSTDEARLWAQVAETVTPLPGRCKPGKVRGLGTSVPATEEKPRSRLRIPLQPQNPAPRAPRPRPADLSHGHAPGLDRRTAQRLKRGKVDIEGRIDLHGLTQIEAQRALTAFVTQSVAAGRRAVLVITGKGLRPDGRVGVLRSSVPHWLNTSPLRPLVRAFSYAAPADGGEGALYVLLTRKDRVSSGV